MAVNNVAPTATFGNGGSVNEGSSGSVSFTDQADASPVDLAAGFTYSYDFGNDGTFEINDSATPSATVPASYLADGPGSRTVRGRITDKDGDFTDYTTTITILNVAPVVTLTAGPTSVDESSSVEHEYTYTIFDPGQDTQTVAETCGTGGVVTAQSNTSTSGSFKCVFDDGLIPAATTTVSVQATDSDLTAGPIATRIVTIHNVIPTITSLTSNPSAAIIGQTITITGVGTDVSAADRNAGLQWRFDTGSGFGDWGASAQTTKLIAACGPLEIRAQARDKDGGESLISTITVATFDAHFLSPLKEGVVNLVQKGRVVPVQITFGCGGHISGLAPEIQLLSGDFVDGVGDETPGDNLITVSVSNADTDQIMREQTGKYHYNLGIPTTNMTPGKKLTVRVRPYGPGTQPTMYILLEIRK